MRFVCGPFSASTVTSVSALSGVANPNGSVTSEFIGQTYVNTATSTVYIASAAGVNNAWQTVS